MIMSCHPDFQKSRVFWVKDTELVDHGSLNRQERPRKDGRYVLDLAGVHLDALS